MKLTKGFYLIGRDKKDLVFNLGIELKCFKNLKEAEAGLDIETDMGMNDQIEVKILRIY